MYKILTSPFIIFNTYCLYKQMKYNSVLSDWCLQIEQKLFGQKRKNRTEIDPSLIRKSIWTASTKLHWTCNLCCSLIQMLGSYKKSAEFISIFFSFHFLFFFFFLLFSLKNTHILLVHNSPCEDMLPLAFQGWLGNFMLRSKMSYYCCYG